MADVDRLEPLTEPGRRYVELAEKHAADAWNHAPERDRDGRFPVEAFEAMKASGLLAAPVPEAFGGLGVTSAHDLAVGLERLGRGDGSIAIATNMHLSFGLLATRMWRGAREGGNASEERAIGTLLSLLGAGGIGMANITEPGTDLNHPLVEAERVDDGWAIRGRKIFGTLSEIADAFYLTVRVREADGDRTRAAIVLRGTPGQEVGHDWDALGMRASGSHSILYDGCVVSDDQMVAGSTPWGDDSIGALLNGTVGQIGLFAVFLGIAERAAEIAKDHARTKTKAPHGRPVSERSGIQHLVAEIEIGLSTSRAMLDRLGLLLDQMLARPVAEVGLDDMYPLARETQCVKLLTNRAAIDVVDRALSVTGGAGYMTGHPLSRLYRDVRAGPFMQPHGPAEAHEFIGKIALGLDPTLER